MAEMHVHLAWHLMKTHAVLLLATVLATATKCGAQAPVYWYPPPWGGPPVYAPSVSPSWGLPYCSPYPGMIPFRSYIPGMPGVQNTRPNEAVAAGPNLPSPGEQPSRRNQFIFSELDPMFAEHPH